MSLLFLILDILVYNFTEYNTFFFLISLNFYKGHDYTKVIILGLFIDLIILSTPLTNTIILLFLFLINKRVLELKNRSLTNFLCLNAFNLVIYNLILILINQNLNIFKFIISLIINFIFYILSYNLCKKRIKLAR